MLSLQHKNKMHNMAMTEEQLKNFNEFARQYLEWKSNQPFITWQKTQRELQQQFLIEQERKRQAGKQLTIPL